MLPNSPAQNFSIVALSGVVMEEVVHTAERLKDKDAGFGSSCTHCPAKTVKGIRSDKRIKKAGLVYLWADCFMSSPSILNYASFWFLGNQLQYMHIVYEVAGVFSNRFWKTLQASGPIKPTYSPWD
jgi:hypothetical protein